MQTLTRPQFLALTDLTVGQFDMMRARNQLPFMTPGGNDRTRGIYFLQEVVMTLVAQNIADVYNIDRGHARQLVAGFPEEIVNNIERADGAQVPVWYCVVMDGDRLAEPIVGTWDELASDGFLNARVTSIGRVRRVCLVDLTAIASIIRTKAAKSNIVINSWLLVP